MNYPAEMYYWISVIRALDLIIILGATLGCFVLSFTVLNIFQKPEQQKLWIKISIPLAIVTFIFILAWVFIPPVEYVKALYIS